MFLRDRSGKKSSGWSIIVLGVGVSVLSLIVIGISVATDTEPAAGRPATLSVIGLPVGVLTIVAGAFTKVREGRRE